MNTKLLLGLTVALSVASIYIYQAQNVESDFQEFSETDGELLTSSNYCYNKYINSDIFFKSMQSQATTIASRLKECQNISNPTIGVFYSDNLHKVTVNTTQANLIKNSNGTYKVFPLSKSNPSQSLFSSFRSAVKNLSYSCWSSNQSQLDDYIIYLRNKFPSNNVSYIEYKNQEPSYYINSSNLEVEYRYASCGNDYYFLFILH